MNPLMKVVSVEEVLESPDLDLRSVATRARGPAGALPLTAEMLLTQPSGNLFGLTMNAGMGGIRRGSVGRRCSS